MSQLDDLTALIRRFRDDRDWARFHTVKNLAASISIEAAELLELVQWVEGDEAERAAAEKRAEIAAELADVAIYVLLLADRMGLDLDTAIREKIAANATRYPVDRARGTARKYTDL